MKKIRIAGALAVTLCLALASIAAAQEAEGGVSGKTRIGLQASTNFEDMLIGLKIQMRNWAITPKAGFMVQTFKDDVDTAFAFSFGCGFDYYLPKWREGKLRPFIGDDVLFNIYDQAETDFWFIDDLHVGAEYWLSDSFSVGGSVGLQFAFGESHFTPNTFGFLGNAESNFSFGMGGMLRMTYYF